MKERLNIIALFWVSALCLGIVFLALLYRYQGNMTSIASKSDLPSYLAVSHTLLKGERAKNPWHERMFFGWPILLMPFAQSGYRELAAILLACFLASLLPAVIYVCSNNFGLSMLLIVASPTFLIQSVLGMSEPASLLFSLLSIMLLAKKRYAIAAACIGFACIVRPPALFLWIPIVTFLVRDNRNPVIIPFICLSVGIGLGSFIVSYWIYGDPFRQFHLYGTSPNIGKTFESSGHWGAPFYWMSRTIMETNIPKWKLAYILVHVIAALLASFIALRYFWSNNLIDFVMSWWVLGNSLFIFCTGPYWAFHSFDRYWLWAYPAYLYMLTRFYQIPARYALLLAPVSVSLAILSQYRF